MLKRPHTRLILILFLAGISLFFRWYHQPCYRAVTEREYTTAHTNIPNIRNVDEAGEVEGDANLNHSHVIKERVNTLRQRCEQLQTNGIYLRKEKFKLDHLVVDDKYKLIYCYIPKVACTNIKKVFLLLTGKLNETDPSEISHNLVHNSYQQKYLRYLTTYEETEVQYRLANYKKIMFVRDPFERLVSAYIDKLVSHYEFYGMQVIRGLFKNTTQLSLRDGKNVTFPEVTKYLIQQHELSSAVDEHWATFQDLCSPCEVGYDFIGSYETMDDDMDSLLHEIGVSDTIRFPKRRETYNETKTSDVMSEFYKQIGPEVLRKLYDIYFNDFFLFGYESKV